MVKIDISKNNLRADGAKALAEALKDNQVMKELNVADTNIAQSGFEMSGVIAIANTIPTMGALTSLNISNNKIEAEGAKQIAAAVSECK